MKKLENHVKFLINIHEDLLKEVQDYQHENKCSNRNEAVIRLIKNGLNAEKNRDTI